MSAPAAPVIPDRFRSFGAGPWRPVTTGKSGASVWTDGRLYIKLARIDGHRDSGFSPREEAERATWLRSVGVLAPEVLDCGSDGQWEWMISRALSGRDASRPWPRGQRDRVIDGLADATARLHSLPVAACPFDRSLAVTIPDARHAVDNDLVDLTDLGKERAGWTGPQLAARLLASRPASEDLVVCHGDLSIPNVLFEPETARFAGFIDVGRAGRADRHADIGIVTRSLGSAMNRQYHPDGQRRFVERYQTLLPDVEIDPEKIEFYRLLDEFF